MTSPDDAIWRQDDSLIFAGYSFLFYETKDAQIAYHSQFKKFGIS